MNETSQTTITSRASYTQSAWVYGSVSMIASAVSDTPFRIFRKTNEQRDDHIETGPLWALIRNPNRYTLQDTSTKFRQFYMHEVLLSGSVMRIFPSLSGQLPTEMFARRRSDFRAVEVIDENGFRIPARWKLFVDGKSIEYLSGDNIYHDALYSPFHDYEGLSPLQAALITIANDVDVTEFVRRYYKNDASTGVVFSTDHPQFTQKQADAAQERFREHHAGVQQAFGAKFMGFGLKPFNVGGGFDPHAQQIIVTMSKEAIIAGIFRIPMELFGLSNQAGGGVVIGGKSLEPAREIFLLNVVIPWAKWYDDEFNKDVTWRFGSEFVCAHDFHGNPTLEARRLERAKTAAVLIDRGVPLNEIIQWLNLKINLQPHGHEWWVENWKLPASIVQKLGAKVYAGGSPKESQSVIENYIQDIATKAVTAKVKNQAEETERDTILRNGKKENRTRILEILENADL